METGLTQFVKTSETDGVLTMTISRPEKKNALTREMYAALSDGVERAEREREIKALLFQGDGDSFTAGNDIDEFRAQDAGQQSEEGSGLRFVDLIAKATKPLVAAV